jgi:hypothetical protein
MADRTGNMPPLPGIFPDYAAPIVRNQPEGRELTMARWGMPSPIFALKGRNSDPGVTRTTLGYRCRDDPSDSSIHQKESIEPADMPVEQVIP